MRNIYNKDNMNKMFSVISCFTMLLLISCVRHEIQVLHTHKHIHIDSITNGTLVIFDVDETLIQPVDMYLINEHTPQGRAFLHAFIKKHPEVKDWDTLTSTLLQQAQRPFIEASIPIIMQKMRDKGAKIIALTAMNTGKVGNILSLEHWRYNHLKGLGFEGDFQNYIIALEGFQRNPVFYKGIAAADLENKGDVLTVLLKSLNYHPQLIVVIDDDLSALRSIQQACHDLKIPFYGYHYKGYKRAQWNKDLIQFQADYLVKNKQWLSDSKAEVYLSKEQAR